MRYEDRSAQPAMHRVAVLALDQVIALDLGVPTQMFHGARDGNQRRYYDVKITTLGGEPVRSSAGFSVAPECGP